MAMLKKKTRKAIRKSVRKVINKHGPVIAQHLATGLAAGVATYLGAGGKKGQKQLKKAVKKIPGGRKILKAISATVPLLRDENADSTVKNGHGKEGRENRTNNSETA
jgi:hypothetical protein